MAGITGSRFIPGNSLAQSKKDRSGGQGPSYASDNNNYHWSFKSEPPGCLARRFFFYPNPDNPEPKERTSAADALGAAKRHKSGI